MVRQLSYHAQEESAGLVEVLSFGRLRQINDGGTQRGDFHVLAVVRAGTGHASVDFTRYLLGGRTVVWIPPGAVHRWEDVAAVTGELVLFTPAAPAAGLPSPSRLGYGHCWSASESAWPYITAAIDHLELETHAPASPAAHDAARLLLSALLIRIAPPTGEALPDQPLFGRFRDLVEAEFRAHHDVAHYAAVLGYSPRTLTRSVHRATGRSAKSFLTQRIMLEAMRLLVHDRYSAARCAAELGFPDPSTFSAFFLRTAGRTPGAWQRENWIPTNRITTTNDYSVSYREPTSITGTGSAVEAAERHEG
ncbi:helix-turn-helix transcriptional regulator [Tsukamurella sp. 8F]|uniref:AraC family transcriptional regulator n=1 Tax=unclassified Tsukamurella TaxID=2633480 RepID=UPI0023BA3659|nr:MULTISPECIES: helix-turn-helix transcriptional regulator [unclassified Tsukamurella]MDF0529776.1 helix-turn-helix transcriptional regulator [Tsukamurella sp. 8J]MDF0586968.1 helix-turn-helix transcriptional regulator [Tsukamurella sp. 8F]